MEKVLINSELNLAAAHRAASELRSAINHERVCMSFSALRFCTPAGILFLASEMKDIFECRQFFQLPEIEFLYDASDPGITYLCLVGFFKYFGHDFGKAPGQARGGETYIPIRTIPRSAIDSKKSYPLEPVGSPISKIADELAILLTKSQDFKRFKPVSYCIREVVRNVFEHSEADNCAMIGQSWKGDEVEIAICDRGIGIRRSLERKYDLKNKNSLLLAIQPGVSKSDTSVQTDDPWANSGFGLYVLSQLGSNLGKFTIVSGTEAIECANKQVDELALGFRGTFVRLRVQRPHGENFPEYIKKIVATGESEANSSGITTRASFSSASLSV